MKLNPVDFGQYSVSDAQRSFAADDPSVQLTPGEHMIERNASQRSVLDDLDLRIGGDNAVFGPSLDWACSAFIVHRHGDEPSSNTVFGGRPPQPVSAQKQQVPEHTRDRPPRSSTLYLFSVLVALEWTPDAEYITQLEWGFRRASDFLFDVTDGCMAFGQVIFGGRELMDCADIQILVSNRLHPRSWVAGLHQPEKYTPVRVGRGLWNRRNQTTIGWDEPEGYRTLVHEWAHYALALRDRYLRFQERALDRRSMVLPDCAIASSTIMATLEGTSELVPHRGADGSRKSDWNRMRDRFPLLPKRQPKLAGPGALPLPLPVFHRVGSLEEAAPIPSTMHRSRLSNKMLQSDPDRCWMFVLREHGARPQQLLAYGTLDGRLRGDLVLHGALPGDRLLAVLQSKQGIVRHFQGTIKADRTTELDDSAPKTAMIDVLPRIADAGKGKPDTAYVVVRVGSDEPPEQVWVFPLGGKVDAIDFGRPDSPDWQSEPRLVPTLDGHVLLRWADGSSQIAPFSQGGGPNSSGPIGFSPVTAGSSNGNVMVFFRDDDWIDPDEPPNPRLKTTPNTSYSDVKIVTTLMPGVDPRLPGRHADATRGYVYSLAANTALPLKLTPTLVMYYDAVRVSDDVKPRIYREVDGHWEELACYPSPRCGYVAVPLDSISASKLVDEYPDGPRVERYRLVWA